MSIRQRAAFKFTEDSEDDKGPILDEQEQEELIQEIKKESEARNAQYAVLLQGLVGVSVILHLVYLSSSTGESPLVVILPFTTAPSRPLPGAPFFTFLALFVHANLSLHLLPSTHLTRRVVSGAFLGHVPLRYPFIYAASGIAPVLSLALWQSSADLLWWCTTFSLVYFVYTAQSWFRQEAEAIQQLDKMRYDAKGA